MIHVSWFMNTCVRVGTHAWDGAIYGCIKVIRDSYALTILQKGALWAGQKLPMVIPCFFAH